MLYLIGLTKLFHQILMTVICAQLHTIIWVNKKWKNFLENINIESRFYYIDHLKDLPFVKNPSEQRIYLKVDKDIILIIDSMN